MPISGTLRNARYYSNLRNRVWISATEAAGLPGLDIHELRHTARSLMIRAGAGPLQPPPV